MAAPIPVILSQERRTSSEAHSTPIKGRHSEAAFHPATLVPLTSIAALAVLGKKPPVCGTRLEQLELEFLMALHDLRILDPESDKDGTTLDGLQSQYNLAREKYKNELWNESFEPVLRRIRVAVAEKTKEESAKSDAVRRLVASGAMIQKEKDVLNGLLGECVRMKRILGNEGLFLMTSSESGESCGSWSDNLHRTREDSDMEAITQTQSPREEELAVISLKGLELTSQPNSTREEHIDLRAYCGHISTSLPTLRVLVNDDTSPTPQTDSNPAPSTVFPPLMTTQFYAAVSKYIPVAQIWAENAALGMLLDREREEFNATHAEVQRRNEEDLSLAADLLIEAMEVQAQTARVRAATVVDCGVSVKIREEAGRRRSAA